VCKGVCQAMEGGLHVAQASGIPEMGSVGSGYVCTMVCVYGGLSVCNAMGRPGVRNTPTRQGGCGCFTRWGSRACTWVSRCLCMDSVDSNVGGAAAAAANDDSNRS